MVEVLLTFVSCLILWSRLYTRGRTRDVWMSKGFKKYCVFFYLIERKTYTSFTHHTGSSHCSVRMDQSSWPCFHRYWNVKYNVCVRMRNEMDHLYIYTGRNRRNGPDFGRVFLMLNHTENPQNTYIQSWTVWEIMASEVWNFDGCYTLTDYQIRIETGRNMWFL